MRPKVAALMSTQNGLVLRRQALAAGMTVEEIGRQVRAGQWIVVRRGVYATAVLWDSLDEYAGRPRLRAQAASRNMVAPHALSHESAMLVHGIPILLPRPELVHITRFGHIGGRTKHRVKHHQAPFTPEQLVEVDGIWTLDIARSAVDMAREHGPRLGQPACDAALSYGIPREDMWEALEAMTCWPCVTRARLCVELADCGADNAWESLTRVLVREIGIGLIETQFGLTDGRRRAWCDLRVGRHIIEFDGQVKYRARSEGGFAPDVDPARALLEEKRRQDFVCGFKLGMSRVVTAELSETAWESTKRRIHREYVDTCARFGTNIDDLAPYVLDKGGGGPAGESQL